jgi:hypothetical protein
MKVKHLILNLQQCDPEAIVVVDGYEGGVSELKRTVEVEIALDVNAGRSYYGRHVIHDDEYAEHHWNEDEPYPELAKAVHLPR